MQLALDDGECSAGSAQRGDPACCADATHQARQSTTRVRSLRVAFGYSDGETRAHWIAHDRGHPILLGLPDYHLATTSDVGISLASILREAEVQDYVHHANTPI